MVELFLALMGNGSGYGSNSTSYTDIIRSPNSGSDGGNGGYRGNGSSCTDFIILVRCTLLHIVNRISDQNNFIAAVIVVMVATVVMGVAIKLAASKWQYDFLL